MQADSLLRALYPDWPKMDDYEGVLKERVERYKAQMARTRIIGDVYRIPVVVHVIHNGEAVGTGTNISDQRIQDQIEVLNEDFRRLPGTPGWNNHSRGADVRIEFVLAKRDPGGNPTTGIVRWNRNAYGWNAPPYDYAYMQGTIKPATQWDPNRYLNIWVADLDGGLLGYAQFPDLSGLLGMPGDAGMGSCTQAANADGVVILYASFGSALKGSFTNNTSGSPPPYQYSTISTSRVALVSPSINTQGATDLVLAFDVRVNGEYYYLNANLYDFGRLFYSTTSASSGFQPLIGCGWTNNTCLLASEQPRAYQLYGYPEVRRVVVSIPSATWNQPNLWLA